MNPFWTVECVCFRQGFSLPRFKNIYIDTKALQQVSGLDRFSVNSGFQTKPFGLDWLHFCTVLIFQYEHICNVFQTQLNDSHTQMIVHWAGQGSDVIIALARDSRKETSKGSNLFISRDYGKTFKNVTGDLSIPSGERVVIDHYYNSKTLNSHVSVYRYCSIFTLVNLNIYWPEKWIWIERGLLEVLVQHRKILIYCTHIALN